MDFKQTLMGKNKSSNLASFLKKKNLCSSSMIICIASSVNILNEYGDRRHPVCKFSMLISFVFHVNPYFFMQSNINSQLPGLP